MREDIIIVLKAQQWEKCKGELRALVAVSGSGLPTAIDDHHWKDAEKMIESFIIEFEGEALHE